MSIWMRPLPTRRWRTRSTSCWSRSPSSTAPSSSSCSSTTPSSEVSEQKETTKTWNIYFLFFFSSLAMASRPREHIICIYLPKGGFNCIFMRMDRYWYQILKLRYDQISSHMGPPTYKGRKVIKTWLTWLINIQNTYILFPMIITIIMIMMMMNISSIIIMNIHTYRSCSPSTTLLCPAPSTPLWELLMRGPHTIFITWTSSLIQYVD